jgi:thiosulfate/3-mercaptopyruvate sulfurtransferase
VIDLRARPLVDTVWLAEHLSDPQLRIVDARWRGDGDSDRVYRAGHLPGAVHLDWHRHLGHSLAGVRDLILPPGRFASLMSLNGIGDETRVVAYAETDHSGAARLWWALNYYGHEQVAVLDGGITKWIAEGRPLTQAVPAPQPAPFTARIQPRWLATADEIQAGLEDPRAGLCLVDTRPPEQYAGRAVWTPGGSYAIPPGERAVDVGGRGPTRGGHIPGAIHLHAGPTNLNPDDWTYFPPETLRRRALDAGLRDQGRLVTYCGCGISASLGLFALHLAGFSNLALYDASWEEWGTDPDRPVVCEP